MFSKEYNLTALRSDYQKIAHKYPELDGFESLIEYLKSHLVYLLLKHVSHTPDSKIPLNLISIIINTQDNSFKQELEELRYLYFIDIFYSCVDRDDLEEDITLFAAKFCDIFEDENIEDMESACADANHLLELHDSQEYWEDTEAPAGCEVEEGQEIHIRYQPSLHDKLQSLIDIIEIEVERFNNDKGPFTFGMARKATEIQEALDRALIWLEKVSSEGLYDDVDFKKLSTLFLESYTGHNKSLYDALNYHRFSPTMNGVSFFGKSQTTTLKHVLENVDLINFTNRMKSF